MIVYIFIIFNNQKIQMHKHKYYKPPKPSTLPQKPIDLDTRPQFTTDFTDPDKYKLSQLQMIQRKAALQSKNRQAARLDLQQRRKKLQMGIIDDDTRKIYQTALVSKNIDLQPSIRRNLSQMIQYQRQRSAKKSERGKLSKNSQQQNYQSQNQKQKQEKVYQNQIKKTQKFIKKLQRVKKQQNISKAVEMLMNDKKSPNFGPTKNSSNMHQDSQNYSYNYRMQTQGNSDLRRSTMRQQQTLSNIQQTIKFMQQKLFNPNYKKNKPQVTTSPKTNPNSQKNQNMIYSSLQGTGMFQKYKQKQIKQIKRNKQSTSPKNYHNQFLENVQFSIASPINKSVPVGNGTILSSITNQNQQDSQQILNMQQKLQLLKLNFNQNMKLFNKKDIQTNHNLKISNIEKKPSNTNNTHLNSQQYQQQQDDQCLSTIRKMKQMMQNNSYYYDNTDCYKYKQNTNTNNNSNSNNNNNNNNCHQININNYTSQPKSQGYRSDGDKQIDFSLTMNQDQIQLTSNKKNNIKNNNNHINNKNINTNTYSQLKKSLFEQIQKLQNQHYLITKQQNTNYNHQLYNNNNNNNNRSKQQITQVQHYDHNDDDDDQQQQDQQVYQVPTPIQYRVKNNTITDTNSNKTKIIQDNTNRQLQNIRNILNNSKNNINSSNLQRISITNSSINNNNSNSNSNSYRNGMNSFINTNNNTNMNMNNSSISNPSSNKIMGFDYRGSINIKKHILNPTTATTNNY